MKNGTFLVLVALCSLTIMSCTPKGGEKMNIMKMDAVKYMTKEEFLEVISTMELDVTADDFSDIDIDDFIRNQFITKAHLDSDDINNMQFGLKLKRYRHSLGQSEKQRELEPFRAKELVAVSSTDEEFTKFHEEFFENSNMKHEFLFLDRWGIANYNILVESSTSRGYKRILVGQTQTLENCILSERDGYYHITTVIESDGFQDQLPFYYSKHFKYFIYANQYNEAEYELIIAFCEMDD